MATVTVPHIAEHNFRVCPTSGCAQNFDEDPDGFVVSGDGSWRNTITCRACFQVRKRVPDSVIIELLHEQLLEAGLDAKLDNVEKWFMDRIRVWEELTRRDEP